MLAVAEALPQTPGISAPSVGILVTVGARTTPASSVLLLHQNIRKILGSFQLQILKEDRAQVNTSVQKIQQSESKLGGNKVVTTKNQACSMIISDTVNSEYNLHDKAGSKPLSVAGSKNKMQAWFPRQSL